MRPIRLELQGFAAFRERTVVDFDGLDVVALTGPTGAGKSTIIDGIVFALYGSVARYGNENLVAPIINSLSNEARVRLDFDVASVSYTAIRIVRRTASGASTKEARLEEGDRVLAGAASELTVAIEKLLGLTFDQFTKTVVLPQGDFARFLTETSGDRQSLLRRLLGLDLYAEMGGRARQRSRDAATERDALRQAMGDMEPITQEALGSLETRADELRDVTAELGRVNGEFEEATAAFEEVDAAVESLDEQIHALGELRVPEDTRDIARNIATTDAALRKIRARVERLTDTLERHSGTSDALPEFAALSHTIAAHQKLDELSAFVSATQSDHDRAAKLLDDSVKRATQSSEQLSRTNTQLLEAQTRAGAAGIAATLSAGDVCPVCARVIDEVIQHSQIDEVDELVDALAEAEMIAEQATAALREAIASEAKAATRHNGASVEASTLSAELEAQPTLRKALAMLDQVRAAEEKVALATDHLDAAQLEATTLDEDLAAHHEQERSGRAAFTEARDSISELRPPAPAHEALADDWRELSRWAKEQTTALRSNRRDLVTMRSSKKREFVASMKTLRRLGKTFDADTDAKPLEIVAKVRDLSAQATTRLEDARQRHERDTANVERCEQLDVEHSVADQLGKHLSTRGFEQWLMADVMRDLAERASQRLTELSSGAYTLVTDGTDFKIRDHRNADELRNTRTLSGGETFVASLALALALADSITDLAAEATTPPIESLFLDEGFGMLDAETLDVVAATIEDLGASGRLIGIVTHVRELADRVPFQIRVSRTASGSTVEGAESMLASAPRANS